MDQNFQPQAPDSENPISPSPQDSSMTQNSAPPAPQTSPTSQAPQDPFAPLPQNSPYQAVAPSDSPTQVKNKKLRRLIFRLAFLALILVLAFTVDWRALFDTVSAIGYEPDATMSQLIARISPTATGERILRASRPSLEDSADFSTHCPNVSAKTSTLGCYTSLKVYVFNVQNTDLDGIREVVLAHEVLHAAWQRLDQSARSELNPLLTNVYNQNKDKLSSHMEYYDDADILDELHSVIGTQIAPDAMPAALRTHYEKYFTDIGAIVALFDSYNGKFVALTQRSEELATQITAKKAEIESKTAKYQQDSQRLNADIDDFNTRAENGYFSDQSSFASERNALISRQQQLLEDYDAISALVETTNRLVAEYNENVILQKELYESIDSSEKTVPTPTPSLGT